MKFDIQPNRIYQGLPSDNNRKLLKEYYPEISDTKYLELLRLGMNEDFVIHSKSLEEFKYKLLSILIANSTSNFLYANVKSVFE